jgi:hypothetical protein
VTTPVGWTAIDNSNPTTLPEPGDWLVTVDTDEGREVHTLRHVGDGKWSDSGVYTFEHSYYFRPIAWAPRPDVYAGPITGWDTN